MKKFFLSLLTLVSLQSSSWAIPIGFITTPSGSTGAVQFNLQGLFGGASDFVYSTGTKTLYITSMTARGGAIVGSFYGIFYGDGSNLTGITGSQGGGSGSSSLAITTGTLAKFDGNPVSSPTAIIVFSSGTFQLKFTGGATAFVTLNYASVTVQGDVLLAVRSSTQASQLAFGVYMASADAQGRTYANFFATHSAKDLLHDQYFSSHSAKDLLHDQFFSSHSAKDLAHDQIFSTNSAKNLAQDVALGTHSAKDLLHDQFFSSHSAKDLAHDVAFASHSAQDLNHNIWFASHSARDVAIISSNTDIANRLNLSTANMAAAGGSINATDNPVSWTRLKDVPAGFADGSDDGSGGGGSGSSSLAVTTGTLAKTDGIAVSSPTSMIIFSSPTFQVKFTPGATAFVEVNYASITAQGDVLLSVRSSTQASQLAFGVYTASSDAQGRTYVNFFASHSAKDLTHDQFFSSHSAKDLTHDQFFSTHAAKNLAQDVSLGTHSAKDLAHDIAFSSHSSQDLNHNIWFATNAVVNDTQNSSAIVTAQGLAQTTIVGSDEGIPQASGQKITLLNFVGPGVTYSQTNGTGTATILGGSSGASSLAITTGTAAKIDGIPVSSPTAIIVFSSGAFTVRLVGGATAFIEINYASITAQGFITPGGGSGLYPVFYYFDRTSVTGNSTYTFLVPYNNGTADDFVSGVNVSSVTILYSTNPYIEIPQPAGSWVIMGTSPANGGNYQFATSSAQSVFNRVSHFNLEFTEQELSVATPTCAYTNFYPSWGITGSTIGLKFIAYGTTGTAASNVYMTVAAAWISSGSVISNVVYGSSQPVVWTYQGSRQLAPTRFSPGITPSGTYIPGQTELALQLCRHCQHGGDTYTGNVYLLDAPIRYRRGFFQDDSD